jgi:hypothetical protein
VAAAVAATILTQVLDLVAQVAEVMLVHTELRTLEYREVPILAAAVVLVPDNLVHSKPPADLAAPA